MLKYIIDDEIVFYPQERQLLSLKNSSTFTIHSTSSNCLTLLLEKHGEVVTQPELMVAGWGENAMRTVSNAAYYQCFVNLRKIFRELGYQKEILITVRGKGIRFNRYVRLKKSAQDEAVVLPLRQQHISPPVQPAEQSLRRTELIPVSLPAEVTLSPDPVVKLEAMNAPVSVKKRRLQRTIFFLQPLGIVLILAFIGWTIAHKKSEFTIDGYHNFSNKSSCIYFNDRDNNYDYIVGFLQTHGYACDAGKKYFVSHFSASPRLTIFICDPRSSLKCDSVTYIVNENE